MMNDEYGTMTWSPGLGPLLDSRLRGNDPSSLAVARSLGAGSRPVNIVPDVGLRTPDPGLKAPSTKYLVLLLTFITHYSLLIAPASAQQPDLFTREIPEASQGRAVSLRFESLGIENGLSQSTVYDMLQDEHGFMWFGTQDGLNRFDGYEVKVFRHEPFDESSWLEGWATALTQDRDGRLWVGSFSSVSVMDPVTETFTHYRHSDDDSTSMTDDTPRRMTVDRNGFLWIATTGGGLDWMDVSDPGRFVHHLHVERDSSSINHDVVYDVLEDAAGTIWVGTRGGLAKLISPPSKTMRGSFARYLYQRLPDEDPRLNRVYSIHERSEEPGVLWLGTSRGLLRFDTIDGSYDRFALDPSDPTGTRAIDIAPDPTNRGVLWVTIDEKGLARFDLRTQRFFIYSADPNDPDGLPDNRLDEILTDRSGVIWVVAERSVERFNPATVGFEFVRSESDNPASMAGRAIWGVALGRDNTLWVCAQVTNGRAFELVAIDRASGTSVTYRHRDDDPNSIPAGQSVVIEDRTGVIWYGASEGLARLHRPTGKFYRFKVDPDDPNSLGHPNVFDIFEDRSGFIWVGTFGGGLHRWDPEHPDRFVRYQHDEDDSSSIGSDLIMDISEDQAGFIWVVHFPGISRLDPLTGKATHYRHVREDSTTLSSDFISSIYERRREPGITWAGTNGAGLNRIDTETGIVTHYTVKDGLPNNTVYEMLEDEEGRLWMSTNSGLSRFDPETGAFRNYGLEVGLQSLEFDLKAAFRAPSGEMFFGGINGLNAFYPNELTDSSVPPEVRIVDLKVGNQSIKTDERVALSTPVPDLKEIKLRYDQKDVTFDFVGFHYEHPEQNQFAYKLDGYNDDWVQVGESRTAPYTNLAPGEYVFRVKAANSAGVWNEEGASIRVVITPPFWATWWFRILAVLAFGGVIFGGYRLRVRQIEQRARLLEGEVDKRTAELQASNEQLEQSHTIVEAINQETSFRRLLTKILEEARVIPGVEKATALVRMPDDVFHVRASSGWDVEEMQHIRLTPEQANERYVEQAEQVDRDIFVAKNVANRAGTEEMAEYGHVASFLVLRIRVEGTVIAYLVFDNLSDEEAFDSRDVELLKRLREHIASAFIKTRILEDLQSTLSTLQSTQDRLIQSEKMASLGQLTAGIAHEIKNPLNFVNNFSDVTSELADELTAELQAAKEELSPKRAAEFESLITNLKMNAQKIAEHGKRADAIVKNMLEHSKVGEGERTPTDLNELLDEYVTLARHGLEARAGEFEVTVERDYDQKVGRVDVVPQDMGRVFMNLLGNAFDALKEHGSSSGTPTVSVSTARVDGAVEIKVSDNGPGIPPKVKAKIFEPFFTTKPTGSGTGLGLSMSYDIVTKGHGGTLEVVSEEGQGATFVVRLPI